MEPSFSIIIPTYNRADSLSKTVKSIPINPEIKYEILIVDDGSTDHTPELIKGLPGICYLKKENGGVCSARNVGVKKSKNEWLIFLDSDDELLANSLSDFKNAILANPSADYIQAKFDLVQEGSKTITSGGKGMANIPGSFAIKKSAFEQVEGYDENISFAENTELMFRLESNGISKTYVDHVVLKYHQSQGGGSKNLKNMRDSLTYILFKHQMDLSNHVRFLYHQNLGVLWMRFERFDLARYHLLNSLKCKPLKVMTLGRYFLACIPYLAKRIYPMIPENL